MNMSEDTAYIVMARLTILPNQELAFFEFEKKAILIMKTYGGKLISAIRTQEEETNLYTEIHTLEFPDRETFQAYRNDKKLLDLSEERKRYIAITRIEYGIKIEY